jgi:hypothetical protein
MSTTRWRSLGAAHRARDAAAASLTRVRIERDLEQTAASLRRWPGIVAAIEAVIAAYSEGTGETLLTVTEAAHQQHPSVTIASADGTGTALVIALDQAELRVGGRSTDPESAGIRRWVDLSRSDDQTAAYVLQEWLERL